MKLSMRSCLLTKDGARDPSFTSVRIPTSAHALAPGRKLLVGGTAVKEFFRDDGVNPTRSVLVVQRIFL